jgi:hypothetical protein
MEDGTMIRGNEGDRWENDKSKNDSKQMQKCEWDLEKYWMI